MGLLISLVVAILVVGCLISLAWWGMTLLGLPVMPRNALMVLLVLVGMVAIARATGLWGGSMLWRG